VQQDVHGALTLIGLFFVTLLQIDDKGIRLTPTFFLDFIGKTIH